MERHVSISLNAVVSRWFQERQRCLAAGEAVATGPRGIPTG